MQTHGYPAEGVSWEDQQPAWASTQSGVHPAMTGLLHGNNPNAGNMASQNGFRRSTSTKSLHQPDFWNGNQMWSAAPPGSFNPMFNQMMGGPGSMMGGANPMNNIHRSMHELHLASGGGRNPMFQGPPAVNPYLRPSSPSNASQKSKGSKRSGNRYKSSKNRRSTGNSRPQSRDANSRNSRRGRHNNEDNSSELNSDSDSEDFFTGESDAADFVSLSSGSNPRKAPRKSWMCEHCTYVNNPGVSVCAMCCRTSLNSRGDEFPIGDQSTIRKETNNKRSNKKGSRYNSSEEESDYEHQRSNRKNKSSNNKSGNNRSLNNSSNSSKKKGSKGNNKHSKSPMPMKGGRGRGNDDLDDFEDEENQISDLEQDAINTYYAVRMGPHQDRHRRDRDRDGEYNYSYALMKFGSMLCTVLVYVHVQGFIVNRPLSSPQTCPSFQFFQQTR